MATSSALNYLSPAQRFMYEYGCFVAFWGNFALMLEVAICNATGDAPRDNCLKLAGKTAGQKKLVLQSLVASTDLQKSNALTHVFDVAERNNWVHGVVLNPVGDFSALTLLRIKKDNLRLTVSNTPIAIDASAFDEFYPAFQSFGDAFEITTTDCDKYILAIQS